VTDPLEALARHGYVVVFAAVFCEQVGLPLPSAPVIIAAGTLAWSGRLSMPGVVGVVLVASLLADALWYALGHRYGTRVLGFLCRLSIEPDTCVRNTEDGFARHGAWLIAISKFVPGLNTAAPPLAGVVGIGLAKFLLIDSTGIVAQALVLAGAGYLLNGPFGRLAALLAGIGGWALVPFAAALGAYLGWKYARRRRALRNLKVERVPPAEVKAMLDAGKPVTIIDLRHRLAQERDPALPGALLMRSEEIEAWSRDIPPGREIVLYCA
jgi:membrane protein DedA with SNARE-associated domain